MRAYEPHDEYFLSNSLNGRGRVLLLLSKEVITYPVTTPFWMMMNLALLVKKTVQLIFHAAQMIHFSKERANRVKALSVQTLDYFCLMGMIPLTRILRVLRKGGALLHPGIYYRSPSLCSWQQQALFYQARAEEHFQKLFLKANLSKNEKEEIWNLKDLMKKKLNEQASFVAKIGFAQECEIKAQDLDLEINEEKLQEFHKFLA